MRIKIKHRYILKNKETKKLLSRVCSRYPLLYQNIITKHQEIYVENVILDNIKVYVIKGEPILIEMENELLFPTISLLNNIGIEEKKSILPCVIIDQGALPRIVNGADIMVPGIIEVIGSFHENEIIQVLECSYNMTIAIGKTIYSSDVICTMKHGKVIKNIHYVGDKIWKIMKQYFDIW
ncbi:MAG: DUF1947 domain-containing protein [Candidatus Methanomethylicia archaeon]|nr:DUF1947 domain-containing protein [Candidatus Methanomethylicia archaeon]MCX8169342.1 DUF1947 domain-containing protein [Candidatus Methanomethylicia archaeon]MDW7988875.1 DUF1947 domain-containing protein [Nitrososphaerota archaeon]